MKFLRYLFDLLCCMRLNTVIEHDDDLEASVHEVRDFNTEQYCATTTTEEGQGVDNNTLLNNGEVNQDNKFLIH